jgi:hypothetical protein
MDPSPLLAAEDPLGTVPFWTGLALILVGLVLVALGSRGSWLAALGGGAMMGGGVAVLITGTAWAPFGPTTPWLFLGAGVIIGLLAGAVGWRSPGRGG